MGNFKTRCGAVEVLPISNIKGCAQGRGPQHTHIPKLVIGVIIIVGLIIIPLFTQCCIDLPLVSETIPDIDTA